jgi:hypothetical protein
MYLTWSRLGSKSADGQPVFVTICRRSQAYRWHAPCLGAADRPAPAGPFSLSIVPNRRRLVPHNRTSVGTSLDYDLASRGTRVAAAGTKWLVQ